MNKTRRGLLKGMLAAAVVPYVVDAVIVDVSITKQRTAIIGYGMNDLVAYTTDGIHERQMMRMDMLGSGDGKPFDYPELRRYIDATGTKFTVFDANRKIIHTGFVKIGGVSDPIPLTFKRGEVFYTELLICS